MVHDRPPAILPSLLACDLSNLASEANRVAPTEKEYVSLSPHPHLSLLHNPSHRPPPPCSQFYISLSPSGAVCVMACGGTTTTTNRESSCAARKRPIPESQKSPAAQSNLHIFLTVCSNLPCIPQEAVPHREQLPALFFTCCSYLLLLLLSLCVCESASFPRGACLNLASVCPSGQSSVRPLFPLPRHMRRSAPSNSIECKEPSTLNPKTLNPKTLKSLNAGAPGCYGRALCPQPHLGRPRHPVPQKGGNPTP